MGAERKTVVVVRWKKKDVWEAWSSLTAFCNAHPAYPRYHIYNRTKNGVFEHYAFELRRVQFKLNPIIARKGGLRRNKPGPKGPRKKPIQ